jgi:hypothetical protein
VAITACRPGVHGAFFCRAAISSIITALSMDLRPMKPIPDDGKNLTIRQAALDVAQSDHPQRFAKKAPKSAAPPARVHINMPDDRSMEPFGKAATGTDVVRSLAATVSALGVRSEAASRTCPLTLSRTNVSAICQGRSIRNSVGTAMLARVSNPGDRVSH